MRRVAAVGLALGLLAGCGAADDADRAAALAEPVDAAARAVLEVLAEEVRLAPEEELDALADTQAETCDDPGSALHRTDATLELVEPPPAGLERRLRAVVPDDLRMDYAVDGTTLEVGVVGACADLGPVRAVELSLEPRYRVRPAG